MTLDEEQLELILYGKVVTLESLTAALSKIVPLRLDYEVQFIIQEQSIRPHFVVVLQASGLIVSWHFPSIMKAQAWAEEQGLGFKVDFTAK